MKLEGIKNTGFELSAETFVTNIVGLRVIRLSAFIKTLFGGQAIYLNLEHKRMGQLLNKKTTSDWGFNDLKGFCIDDTLNLMNEDTIKIKIVQSTGQNSACLVDLVELTTTKLE